MSLERLQKIIAAAGIASRRKAEELIQSGMVSVNGNVVTELGSKADPETDSIKVNNKLLKGAERHEYVMLNKPRGYVTTVSDPEGRPTIMELVRSKARLYPVGRLDFNSEGLLLLTNDGELAHKLMKAASHVPKTYLVKISGQPSEDQLDRLRAGISIAEERDPNRRVRTAPAQIRILKEADNPWFEVTLFEGRNRQIRKMFEEIGHHTEKIRRVRYGPLELDVPPGESRTLNEGDLRRLRRALESDARPSFGDRTDRPRRPRDADGQEQRSFRAPRERSEGRRDRPPAERQRRFARPAADRPRQDSTGERPRREQRPERRGEFSGRREQRPPRFDRAAERPFDAERLAPHQRSSRESNEERRGARFDRSAPGGRSERPNRDRSGERPEHRGEFSSRREQRPRRFDGDRGPSARPFDRESGPPRDRGSGESGEDRRGARFDRSASKSGRQGGFRSERSDRSRRPGPAKGPRRDFGSDNRKGPAGRRPAGNSSRTKRGNRGGRP